MVNYYYRESGAISKTFPTLFSVVPDTGTEKKTNIFLAVVKISTKIPYALETIHILPNTLL